MAVQHAATPQIRSPQYFGAITLDFIDGRLWSPVSPLVADGMERFVHNANIEYYRRLISESERDPARGEDRHAMLLRLLAEELAQERKPLG